MTGALMMAAMMLPGAAPAVARRGRVPAAAIVATSYFAIWIVVGLALGALGEPRAGIAGAIVIAAGLYELTPIKREYRRRCREDLRSGVQFGVYCVVSSIGLMAAFVALGVMSLAWIAIFTAVVLAQKVLAPDAALDTVLALAIVALGVAIAIAPESVPGYMPAGM